MRPSRAVMRILTYARKINKVKRQKAYYHLSPFTFHFSSRLSFCLLDSQLTTIVSAARTDGVVDVQCTTVRACCQCRSFYYVMGTTFCLSGVALSSFRMCHNILQFYDLRFNNLVFVYLIGFRFVTKVIMEEKFHLLVALTRLVTVNDRNIDTYNFIGEPGQV